jgi:Mce-associated membrane protein
MATPPTPSRAARSRALLAAAVLALVAAGGAAFAAVSARQVSADTVAADSRAGALAAARQISVDLLSYDYRHLAQDFRRVADESVGQFHKQFLSGSTGAYDNIVKYKIVSQAQVVGAGVVSASPTRAVVLVAADRAVRTGSSSAARAESNRFQLTLVRQHGRWVVSQVASQ